MCLEKLPCRTYDAIKSKANKLNLKRDVQYKDWEVEILRKYYPSWGAKKCHELLPHRPVYAIQAHAKKVGVKCDLIRQRRNLGLKRKDMPKGFYEEASGYLVYTPNGRTSDRILHHRYVMEKHLGRKLSSDEIIHHKDGDKWNNNISNLEIVTRAEHINIHRDELEQMRGLSRHSPTPLETGEGVTPLQQ